MKRYRCRYRRIGKPAQLRRGPSEWRGVAWRGVEPGGVELMCYGVFRGEQKRKEKEKQDMDWKKGGVERKGSYTTVSPEMKASFPSSTILDLTPHKHDTITSAAQQYTTSAI